MRKEKGISISLTEEELKDKFIHYRKADGRHAWWETKDIPKELEEFTKFTLYVAVEGKVKGLFMVHERYPLPDEEGCSVAFYPESWKPTKKGEKVKARKEWQYYPIGQ
jgi:hypothetical protein